MVFLEFPKLLSSNKRFFLYTRRALRKTRQMMIRKDISLMFICVLLLIMNLMMPGCEAKNKNHQETDQANDNLLEEENTPEAEYNIDDWKTRAKLIHERIAEFEKLSNPTPTRPIRMKSLINPKWEDTSGYWPGYGPYKFQLLSYPLLEDEILLDIETSIDHKQKAIGSSIPDDVIHKLTTSDLIETCLRYPTFEDGFKNSLQADFQEMRNHFNGLTELYKRSDAGEILFDFYRKTPVDPQIPDVIGDSQDGTPYTKRFNRASRIRKLHVMLGDEELLTKLGRKNQYALLHEIINKYNHMKSDSYYGGIKCKNIEIAYLLVHLMKVMKYPPFINKLAETEPLADFANGIDDYSGWEKYYPDIIKYARGALSELKEYR